MILTYHKVYPTVVSKWWVAVDTFYNQMLQLSSKKIVLLDDYDVTNPEHVVISFDGVYSNVLTFAAPILQYFGYPFELFITGDHIGKGNDFDSVEPPAQFASIPELERLMQAGGRLQWHTRSHQNLQSIEDPQLLDFELSVPDELRRLDPKGFQWVAYPHGAFSEQTLNSAAKHFRGGLSCHQGNAHDPYMLNRVLVFNENTFSDQSIGIAVVSYNYGKFLSEAIESVLLQTRLPNSLLIIDDCSSDCTSDIGRKYQGLYPDLIRFERNEENLGIVETFNKAVSLLKTDYLCFLGADNRLHSNYIEETARTLDRGPESLAIAYTDYALFGDLAQFEYLKHSKDRLGPHKSGKFFIISFPEFDRKVLSGSNFIHGSSMYKYKAFSDIGGYLEQAGKPEDHNLFLRMISKGWEAQKVSTTFLDYRQHSPEQANTKLSAENELLFLKLYTSRLEKRLRQVSLLYDKFGWIIRKLMAVERKISRGLVKLQRFFGK